MNAKFALLLIDNSNIYKNSLNSIIKNILNEIPCDIFICGEKKYENKILDINKILENNKNNDSKFVDNIKYKYIDISEDELELLYKKFAIKNHNFIKHIAKENIKQYVLLNNCFNLIENKSEYNYFIKCNLNLFCDKKLKLNEILNELNNNKLLIGFNDTYDTLDFIFICNLEILKKILMLKDTWGKYIPISRCKCLDDINYFNNIGGVFLKHITRNRIKYKQQFRCTEGEFHSGGYDYVLIKCFNNKCEQNNHLRFRKYK